MRPEPQRLDPPVTIEAATVRGQGRGKKMQIPTINLEPSAAPSDLAHGIYACRVTIGEVQFLGALHFGPRPVFNDDTPTLEVHLLDTALDELPTVVNVKIVAWLRNVENFENPAALKSAIDEDIAQTRAILKG